MLAFSFFFTYIMIALSNCTLFFMFFRYELYQVVSNTE